MSLTSILFKSLGELVDCGRHLQSLHKNSLLALNTDVLGPLHETGEVSLGLDVSTESEVFGVLLEEGGLGGCTTGGSTRHNNLLSFDSFLHLYSTTKAVRVVSWSTCTLLALIVFSVSDKRRRPRHLP